MGEYKKKGKTTVVTANEFGKLPPQAPELEENIIGVCIRDPDMREVALRILKSECFYKVSHQVIFKSIEEMVQSEIPIDIATLVHYLRTTNRLDEVGGPYYVSVIYNNSATTIDIEYYCYVIFELFVKREMIQLFTEETSNLYSEDSDIFDVYNRVENKLEETFDKMTSNQIKHMKTSIDKTLNEIESYDDGSQVSFIKTGIPLFDNHAYLSPGMVVGIAAPRGAGKTRYVIYLMKKILELNHKDISCMWCSYEDSDTKIIRCFAATNTGLSDSQMQSKGYKLSSKELSALKNEINSFSSYDIEFSTEQEDMATISRKFNRFVKKRPDKINILIIDNVMLIDDLLTAPYGSANEVENKVAASMRKINTKAAKNGYKTIVIFLHHMTKEMEGKANAEEAYRPKLSYVKGSSRFVDIANVFILLHNPGMYKDLIKKQSTLPDVKCLNSDGSTIFVKRESLLRRMLIAEIAKNRDGEMADDNIAVQRYIVDFSIMKIKELKCLK